MQNLGAGLALKGITVTQWGALLYGRLDVSVAYIQFDFLVDDDLLEAGRRFTEEQGYHETESIPILTSTQGMKQSPVVLSVSGRT